MMKSKCIQFDENELKIFATVYGKELLTPFLRRCISEAIHDRCVFDMIMFGGNK